MSTETGQLQVGDMVGAENHDGSHVVSDVRESFWPDCSVYEFTDGCSAYAVPHDRVTPDSETIDLLSRAIAEARQEPERARLHNDLARVLVQHYGNVRLSVREAAVAAALAVVDDERQRHIQWLRQRLDEAQGSSAEEPLR